MRQLEIYRGNWTNVVANTAFFAQVIKDYGDFAYHAYDFRRTHFYAQLATVALENIYLRYHRGFLVS
jgi:hypothetical protein